MNSTSPGIPSEKILIVDDDAVVIKALSMKLKAKGFEVFSAMEASEAVKAVREKKPQVIVLDVSFPPDMAIPWDGFRIMEWLRRLDEAKHIPIIVISGGDSAKLKPKAQSLGAADFFQKPVDEEKLITVIRSLLSNPGGQSKPS